MTRSAWWAVLLLAAGCGGGGTADLSGRVTYAGAPVPAGMILFDPDGASGNTGPGGQAEIRDGTYRTLPGRGVVGGRYVVRIQGGDGVGAGELLPAGRPVPPSGQYQTTVDLPAGGAFDFDIPAEEPTR